MEPPELYIPPCCIHKQLPGLIRQGGAFSVFYSHGDWGLPKLTYAVESLVPSQGQSVTTILVMPDATLATVRYIARELNMGWSCAIILVTASDQTAFLRKNISPGHLPHLTYCPKRPAANSSNLWIRRSDESHLLITGPIRPEDNNPAHASQYTASYAAEYAPDKAVLMAEYESDEARQAAIDADIARQKAAAFATLRQAFAPWRSMIRLHATLRGTDPLLDLWLK